MSIARLVRSLAGLAAMVTATQAFAADPEAGGLAALCGECRPVLHVHCAGFFEGPNFDREGHLWAVDLKGGNIVEVVEGVCRNVANTGGAPNGARFAADGRLFVTDAKRGLLIYDPRSKALTVRAATVAGKPIVGANDLVFDRAGGLYMTVRGTSSKMQSDGMVLYLAPGDASQPQIIADGLPFPNGLALSTDGAKLFVGLYADKTIIVLPPADRPEPYLTSWVHLRTEGGVGPDGMMIDSASRLWWANYGDGAISVAGPTGRLIGKISLPDGAGPGTTNMTVHDGALYITEATKGDIWRMPLTAAVTPPAR